MMYGWVTYCPGIPYRWKIQTNQKEIRIQKKRTLVEPGNKPFKLLLRRPDQLFQEGKFWHILITSKFSKLLHIEVII